jgi:hypothetical protein
LQPEPSRFLPQVAETFSRFYTAIISIPVFKITPLFNGAAAKHHRRLSKFAAQQGGKEAAFISSRFYSTPATMPAQPEKTIQAGQRRLRSRWRAKNFAKPFKPV